eukprot:CAMPEP_0202685946 /NCGR_PEP_ID=MMETSP1385-20130828/1748_1 /ASSEMBLY_ACC=CAM_ASM_000861 /TAXON_ID=933848 /ORGANISM="Elphidium margaritaceum" /LENGTH=478 /DNA_ID=CAMNT_0049340421 /DNA_START=32 /DNA_END=1468 /DNA_ORIENTATION=+
MATRFAVQPRVSRLASSFKLKGDTSTDHQWFSGLQALAAGAHIYLNFMSLTKHPASRNDSNRKNYYHSAATRYLIFDQLKRAQEQPATQQLVPTRDISMAWTADLLRPTEYSLLSEEHEVWFNHQQHRLLQSGALFKHNTGRERRWATTSSLKGAAAGLVIGAAFGGPVFSALGAVCGSLHRQKGVNASDETQLGSAMKSFDHNQSGVVTKQERKTAMDAWLADYKATSAIWESATSSQYRVPFCELPPNISNADDVEKIEKIDALTDAMISQESFNSRILALGPQVVNEVYIERAVNRYCSFLELARLNPGKLLVPTLDIDLIWHVHMLTPHDYREDCHEIMGRLLSHDTGHRKDMLAVAFEETQRAWEDTFDEEMVQKMPWPQQQSMKKDTNRYYAGCGSCGFGDRAFHDNLGHHEVEGEMIREASVDIDGDGEATEPTCWADDSTDQKNGDDGCNWDFFDGNGESSSDCASCGGD